MTMAARALGAVVGYAMDRALGEPPDAVHPLVAMGHGLSRLEAAIYQDSRRNGVLHTSIAVGATTIAGQILRTVAGPFAATAVAVAISSSSKMLGTTAIGVADALEIDGIEVGRHQLRSLVGRDPSRLDEQQISRAVVESVAENTVDGVTATLCWAVVGGPSAVLAHRVVNTLDAMVGHRNERYRNFGWASARLDDAMNWVPARLTAAAIAVSAPRTTSEVCAIVARDGAKHPSPNGGRVEAATAGALGITLGGVNDYGGHIETRGPLGDGRPPEVADIAAAVDLTRRASDLIALFALGIGALITVGRWWRR